mmetsp:Transcript_7344/g.15111  ORF Transcript_7344/g.15111 Transcript_7344/m.15111 type:complete len:239 (+) Transcript_7344:1166-1882(+)
MNRFGSCRGSDRETIVALVDRCGVVVLCPRLFLPELLPVPDGPGKAHPEIRTRPRCVFVVEDPRPVAPAEDAPAVVPGGSPIDIGLSTLEMPAALERRKDPSVDQTEIEGDPGRFRVVLGCPVEVHGAREKREGPSRGFGVFWPRPPPLLLVRTRWCAPNQGVPVFLPGAGFQEQGRGWRPAVLFFARDGSIGQCHVRVHRARVVPVRNIGVGTDAEISGPDDSHTGKRLAINLVAGC